MCESMDPPTPNFSPTSMDRLNNNTKELAIIPRPPSSTSQADFTRSRELMGALCTANPQFTASVLEDYIRPIFRFLPIHNLWDTISSLGASRKWHPADVLCFASFLLCIFLHSKFWVRDLWWYDDESEDERDFYENKTSEAGGCTVWTGDWLSQQF